MIDVVEREDRAAGTYLERLFEQHERRLGQFLVHVVRDRALAEDLLQETFLAAWRARGELDAVVNPESWLFGIARHRALRALRGAQRLRRALERVASTPAAALDEGPWAGRGRAGADPPLPRPRGPRTRGASYVHGFDAPELAEMTGRCSPAAIRKRLERARTTLLQEATR